jgi:NADH-quinone oxidoreductase subunit J
MEILVHFVYSVLFAVALVAGSMVVLARKPIHCALWLILSMCALAGIFLMIHAPFVALIQILVYAGAIMVLFLYVIMLLNPRLVESVVQIDIARPLAAVTLVGVFLYFMSWRFLLIFQEIPKRFELETVGVHELATRMLTEYLLPFELTSILLLVAIIGAVLIAKRN